MLTRFIRSSSSLRHLLAIACLALGSVSASRAAGADAQADYAQQRAIYLQARDALAGERLTEYERLRDQLRDYPLLPYLEYAELIPRLASLASEEEEHAEIDRFLERYPGTWLARQLERAWVDALARLERWDELLRYHNPTNSTTETTCMALTAALESGDRSVLEGVAPLWNVARSQPNICDPVFEAWMEAGLLTPEVAWDRFSKTLRARQHSLARYIARQMPAPERALAELYLQVDSNPQLLAQPAQFSAEHPQMQEIVLHGLRQLSLRDARTAMQLWQTHAGRQQFDTAESASIQRFIAQRMLLQGHISETEAMLASAPDLTSESLISWLLRDALKQQDWPRVETMQSAAIE